MLNATYRSNIFTCIKLASRIQLLFYHYPILVIVLLNIKSKPITYFC